MMNRFIALLFLAFTFCFISKTMATDGGKKERKNYEYLLYLPKDYQTSNKKYPLVIYLHGSSQRGKDLSKLKAYGLPQLIEQGADFEFIIASPQCPSEAPLWSSENWFEPLFEELSSKLKIDLDRVYLTGISMGGGGTFEVAKDNPDKFAALVPLCAWQSSASDICKLKNVPIWTFHGVADDIVPISQTTEKVKKLNDCKGNVKFTQLEKEGHSIHWLYADKEKYRIFDWMLSHKKKQGK
jgi:predicted peptidase